MHLFWTFHLGGIMDYNVLRIRFFQLSLTLINVHQPQIPVVAL